MAAAAHSALAQSRGELLCRAPGIRKTIVERHRRQANRVRLAPVADHASLPEDLIGSPRPLCAAADANRELAAALLRVGARDDLDLLAAPGE